MVAESAFNAIAIVATATGSGNDSPQGNDNHVIRVSYWEGAGHVCHLDEVPALFLSRRHVVTSSI